MESQGLDSPRVGWNEIEWFAMLWEAAEVVVSGWCCVWSPWRNNWYVTPCMEEQWYFCWSNFSRPIGVLREEDWRENKENKRVGKHDSCALSRQQSVNRGFEDASFIQIISRFSVQSSKFNEGLPWNRRNLEWSDSASRCKKSTWWGGRGSWSTWKLSFASNTNLQWTFWNGSLYSRSRHLCGNECWNGSGTLVERTIACTQSFETSMGLCGTSTQRISLGNNAQILSVSLCIDLSSFTWDHWGPLRTIDSTRVLFVPHLQCST